MKIWDTMVIVVCSESPTAYAPPVLPTGTDCAATAPEPRPIRHTK